MNHQWYFYLKDYVFTLYLEAYLESCQRSEMEGFAKTSNNLKAFTILTKCSMLDASQGPEYATVFLSIVLQNIPRAVARDVY